VADFAPLFELDLHSWWHQGRVYVFSGLFMNTVYLNDLSDRVQNR
jgi:hypothetical protein